MNLSLTQFCKFRRLIYIRILLMEQFGEQSANGLRNPPQGVNSKPVAAEGRISKKGGVRFSFQKRTSEKYLKERNSKLNLSTPSVFEKANWELALENTKKKMNLYWKEEQISLWVDLEHFKMYGHGIFLFFNFLKYLTIAFMLMSIVELVPIIYNFFSGNGLSTLTISVNYYFAKTTIASFYESTSTSNGLNKFMNVIPDIVSIFIFISFYFYWLYYGNILTEQVRKEVKLKSSTVVELTNPPNVSEDEISRYMNQFGRVMQVAPVKDYAETIYLSKIIFDLEVQIKQLQLQRESEPSQQLEATIKQCKSNIDEIYKQLVLYEDDTKEDILKYYVSFQSIEGRQKVIQSLTPYMKRACDCCADPPPQNYLLGGQMVKVEACHTEPREIIWQNQHISWKTRWIRAIVQFIALLVVVALGFLLISFLNVLAPTATTSVDTSSYTSTTIQSQTNTTTVQSWCISNSATVLQSSDSNLNSLCWSYIEKYYLKIGITISIAVAVIIVKALVKLVVVSLAEFQRYKSHTDQSKDITQNLFLTYLCTTVLITFLLQAEIGDISFKNLISYFINSSYLTTNLNALSVYSDFVSDWYINIGYQIVITWAIMIIHPNLTMPLVHHLQEIYNYWKAKKNDIQINMEKAMEPMDFDIEDNYATILMTVFVSIGLSSGIPFITIVTFFVLLLKYLYLKYTFIRFCKTPKIIDQALDLKVSGLLPYSVCVHFMFGIWMFGVTSIFSSDSSTFTTWVNSLDYSFLQQIGSIISRVLGTWYYSVFFAAILLVFFFKLLIYNLIVSNFFTKSKDDDIIRVKSLGNDELFNSNTFCDSYKLENNPDYAEILSIMKQKRKFVVRVKEAENSI